MDSIQANAVTSLEPVALAAISFLAAFATACIHKAKARIEAETAKIKDEQARQTLDDALDDVDNLATLTVQATEQTTAAELRQAVKDGKADKGELLALGKQAFDAVKAAVAPEAQAAIAKNLGSFDTYLQNLIEAKVLALKTATK